MIFSNPARGWDTTIYYRAMQALVAGLDPYATAIARQYAAQAAGQHTFAYVYPPVTLLALRALNLLPFGLAALLYWMTYSACYVGQVWATAQCFRTEDRSAMQYAVPLIIFFPGLMIGDVILSGNIACIFYGAVFTAAVAGWKCGNWSWFYLAVLFAACFKLPLLTLLAIPLFAGERQWLKATFIGALGVGLLGLQSLIWPIQFRGYLTSVGLQFKFNADFGMSPAGVFARFLYQHGLSYSTPSLVAFLIYAGALFLALFYFSNLYRKHRISAESWMPVLLVGTILLNPRIMQYDVHPVSLLMALILMRSVAARSKAGFALAGGVLLLIIVDLAGISPPRLDDLRNMLVVVAVMACGLRSLVLEAQRNSAAESARFEPALISQ